MPHLSGGRVRFPELLSSKLGLTQIAATQTPFQMPLATLVLVTFYIPLMGKEFKIRESFWSSYFKDSPGRRVLTLVWACKIYMWVKSLVLMFYYTHVCTVLTHTVTWNLTVSQMRSSSHVTDLPEVTKQ